MLAFIITGVLAAIAIDYTIRLPSWLRFVVLAAGLVGAVWLVVRVAKPLRAGPPNVIATALRLEGTRAPSAPIPRLAAAADLAQSATGTDALAEALREHALARALDAVRTPSTSRALRFGPALAPLLALAVLVAAVSFGISRAPGLARTGLARTLAPWTDAHWPTRYVIDDRTDRAVHPIDRPLDFSISLVRSPSTDPVVRVRYRVRADDRAVNVGWTTVRLMHQNAAARAGSGTTALFYEHRISPAELTSMVPAGSGTLEYVVLAGDANQRTQTIALESPPTIARVRVSASPPEYARALASPVPLDLTVPPPDLSPDRLIDAGRYLAGTTITLRFEHTPIPEDPSPAWLGAWRAALAEEAAALAPEGAAVSPTADVRSFTPGATASTLVIRLAGDVSIPVRLVDEHGLSPRGSTTIRISARTDERPSAAVLAPDRDERVLATATIDLVAEALDDLRLASAAIETTLAHSAAPATEDDWRTLATREQPGEASVLIDHRLDLQPYDLEPGDVVLVRVRAEDTYLLDGVRHPVTYSPLRRLSIISPEELVDDLRAELAGVRRTARLLDEDQRAATRDAASIRPDAPNADEERARVERLQDSITSRLEGLRATIARLDQRRASNALADQPIEGLLSDAADVTDEAVDASERATRDTPPGDAAKAREIVRDRLGELMSMLDRGEDGWLARRSVERLADEQRELMRDTEAIERALRGRTLDELTPDERSDLQRIADRQRETADALDSTLDELDERASGLSEADPGQAAALAEAADAVRRAAAGQQMRDAADSISQNQTGTASGQQQAALDALEDALDEIDNAGQRRDDALRRRLASLTQSIKSLVRVQENELEALATDPDAPDLDERMIRLHQNTLAVQAESSGGFRELNPVTGFLDAAASAQTEAIVALRGADGTGPRDTRAADAAERISLIRLREALKAAESVQQDAAQREADRQREELKQAYRDALELQIALRTEAVDFVSKRLSRRERSTVRSIGARQTTLRETLDALLVEAEALADARVFRLAHTRLDALMDAAASALSGGETNASVLRSQDGAIAILRALVTALSDDQQTPSEFQDANPGGPGGPSGGQDQDTPAIPPLAELLLLRAMQEHAAELTRAISESPDTPDDAELEHLAALQRSLADEAEALLKQLTELPDPDADPEPVLAPTPENEAPSTPEDAPRSPPEDGSTPEPSAGSDEEPIEGTGP